MSVQAIASTIPPISTEQATPGGAVGKDEFLRLLVTQLQRQDPLNPQDPTEFTAQLAQFSSLEQLIAVNENIGDLADAQLFGTRMSAASLIGRQARIQGDRVEVVDGQASPVWFNLPRDAEATSIEIYSQDGRLVEVVGLGPKTAGSHAMQWDGLLPDGTAAADGSYRFKIVASDDSGAGITATTSFNGRITGISFENGQAMVKIGGASWPLSAVLGLEE
jgi:flagellar basal-body rod modification protein FlgD